ncbi:MAG: alpha/beta fold hydrolase [Planctomycetaceae bacterium]|nr:alpha/beta fold hydrolase [Planctomycetaceae bacterium]
MSRVLELDGSAGIAHLGDRFELVAGGCIEGGVVAFERHGPPNAPLLVALGGISADRRVGRWWSRQVGPGRCFDTNSFQCLGIDWIGGAGASSSPQGGWPGPDQVVDARDQARGLVQVLDALGVGRAALLVGASYGGQVALAAGALHPKRFGRLAVLGAAHRADHRTVAQRSLVRRVLELGAKCGAQHEALCIARGLGLVTYLGAGEWERRFSAALDVGPWLEHQGRRFAQAFDAAALWRLTLSLDRFALDPERIQVPLALLSFDGDLVVPPSLVSELAERCARPAGHQTLPTEFGHDAFLREHEAVGDWLVAQRDAALAEGGAQ